MPATARMSTTVDDMIKELNDMAHDDLNDDMDDIDQIPDDDDEDTVDLEDAMEKALVKTLHDDDDDDVMPDDPDDVLNDEAFLAELASRIEVTFEEIPIEELNVDDDDRGYQRIVEIKRIRAMIKKFNPLLLDPIVVSIRDDGTYWVVDGHHRLEMYRFLGVKKVWCRLVVGLSQKDEARLFIAMSKGRKAISPYDTHKAKLVAGMSDAIAIQKIVDELGYRLIDQARRGAHEMVDGRLFPIASVAAVYTVYNLDKGETLAEALELIREIWSLTDPDVATERDPILGMARFLSRCRGHYDRKRLTRLLSRTSPEVLKSKGSARAAMDSANMTKAEGYACAMVSMYNKGLQSEDKRIPEDVVL